MPSALAIWGSTALSVSEKIVWYRDWTLDSGGPRGCYAEAGRLSHLLGGSLTTGTIERIRFRLQKRGLHQAVKNEFGVIVGWIPLMPPGFQLPRTAAESAGAAVRLDAELAKAPQPPELNGDSPDTEPTFSEHRTPIQRPVNGGSVRRARGPSGGVGGVPSQQSSETTLPSQFSSQEKGSRSIERTSEKRGGEPLTAREVTEAYWAQLAQARENLKKDREGRGE